jgi:hypothetical protein
MRSPTIQATAIAGAWVLSAPTVDLNRPLRFAVRPRRCGSGSPHVTRAPAISAPHPRPLTATFLSRGSCDCTVDVTDRPVYSDLRRIVNGAVVWCGTGLRRERMHAKRPERPALSGQRPPLSARAMRAQIKLAHPVYSVRRADRGPAPITRLIHLLGHSLDGGVRIGVVGSGERPSGAMGSSNEAP